MNGNQYQTALRRLGLNKDEAARFLRVSDRTSRTYAVQGAQPVVAMLLTVMLEKGITVDEIDAIMKRKPSRAKRVEPPWNNSV